jgi:flagella basal body P-ring formation protein FlgA
VVSAGKPVRVLWNEGNVSVAVEGVALNDAAVGQSVRVRTSGRIGVVAGTATAPGVARMN